MTTGQTKTIRRLTGKKIALLGFGLDNQALLALLDGQKIKAEVTICDRRSRESLPAAKLKNLKISYQLGGAFNQGLENFDVLFRSPGWPLSCPGIKKAKKAGRTEISSPLNLFFSLCPAKNTIGVTGSKGKGTTASLIYQILKEAGRATGKKVWLGGNIGVSPLSFLEKIGPRDFVVLELSSFQLEDLQYSPRYAVLTNLFREHLAPADPNNPNFHPSYKSYWQAKLNIARHEQNEHLIANAALKARLARSGLRSPITYFEASPLPSRLTGNFNRENVGAAVQAAKLLKIKPAIYERTIARFKNLEHRLELAAEVGGVRYYDNSFSTTPESTILDLQSFNAPILLIAGGADKGADFKPLSRAIERKVKFLLLLDGQATPRLKKALEDIGYPREKMAAVSSMKEAIAAARSQAAAGDVVLLSTACASFGMFRNYKERGDQFKTYARDGK